jgi:hypothetical protein
MLSMVLSLVISGVFVKKTGHYWGLILIGPLYVVDKFTPFVLPFCDSFLTSRASSVAGGLLFTIDENTPLSRLIGYQILFGIGVGIPMQCFTIALMADTQRKLIPQAIAVAAFFQRVGGSIGLAV